MYTLTLRVSPKSLLCRHSIAEWGINLGGLQSLEHEVQGTDLQHRFACIRTTLIVFAVATTPTQPGEGAFDHPTFGQQHEAFAFRRASHHFQTPGAFGFCGAPVVERMIMVLVIGPYHFQTWVGGSPQVLQNLGGGDRVIDSGTAHKEDQQQPQRIDTDVAFSSGDFLAAVIPSLPATLGGFHRLTINTGSTWCRLLRGGLVLSDLLAQRVHHMLPRPIVSPLRKILISGAFRKQVVRQHVPLATSAVEVQDGVDDFTHINFTRASSGLSRWNQWLQNGPLLLCQVRLIGFARCGSHGDLRKNGLKSMATVY